MTTSSSRRFCLWLALTLVSGREAAAQPEVIRPDPAGVHNIEDGARAYFWLAIHSYCSWEQTVTITVNGQTSTVSVMGATDVPFSERHPDVQPSRFGRGGDADYETYDVSMSHAESVQGDKVCGAANRSATFKVRWWAPGLLKEPPKGFLLGAPSGVVLELQETTRRTPPTTTANTPPPASPQPDDVGVTTGTGLEFKPIGVDGANPGFVPDPDDLGTPPEARPAPKKPTIDDAANFETFPPLPPEGAAADEPLDLGGLVIGAENETVPDITRRSFRELSPCLEDVDCVLPESTATGYFLGNPQRPRGSVGDSAFQHIGAEALRVQIAPIRRVELNRDPMNPLGLLSKSVKAFIDWWMPTLEAAEQGVQQGLQMLITSQGGSTGKNLTLQILNFSGRPVNFEGMIALEPLKKEAQQRSMQAFAKLAGRQLPTKIDLNGYCLEFLKLPPVAGQVLRFAGPEVQKRFAPMKAIMSAANRLTANGALKPDSNPASYADSIKQWALWTVEQKFNDRKFGEAFLGHTKKNVEGAGQKWTRQIEDVVRQRIPNRWQDIVQVLTTAGAAIPK